MLQIPCGWGKNKALFLGKWFIAVPGLPALVGAKCAP